MKKDIYKEMRYGKKSLTTMSVILLIFSVAVLAFGVILVVRGAINPNGAWQIIWRVLLGGASVVGGGILLGVGITMFSVSRSMINVEQGNVSDVGNSAMGTANIHKCEKCGRKLSEDKTLCDDCEKEKEN